MGYGDLPAVHSRVVRWQAMLVYRERSVLEHVDWQRQVQLL